MPEILHGDIKFRDIIFKYPARPNLQVCILYIEFHKRTVISELIYLIGVERIKP